MNNCWWFLFIFYLFLFISSFLVISSFLNELALHTYYAIMVKYNYLVLIKLSAWDLLLAEPSSTKQFHLHLFLYGKNNIYFLELKKYNEIKEDYFIILFLIVFYYCYFVLYCYLFVTHYATMTSINRINENNSNHKG